MIVLLQLFALSADAGTAHHQSAMIATPEPPAEMIDFLGRRQQCAGLGEIAASDRSDRETARLSWLRCGELGAEESGFKRRFSTDPSALMWLDQSPSDFKLDRVTFDVSHVPLPTLTRVLQEGVDVGGTVQWHAAVDRTVSAGSSTAIVISWNNYGSLTLVIPNTELPQLDLAGLQIRAEASPYRDLFVLRIPYGFESGWCGDFILDDDRPHLSITVDEGELTAYRTKMTNCDHEVERFNQSDLTWTPDAGLD